MSKKTYVVTGGTGFIGSVLVRRLVHNGNHVRVIDNDLRGNQHRISDVVDDLELVRADVRNPEAMIEACKGADSVLHLAALNGTENFYNRPDLVLDVGVRGMLAMLEAAKACDIKEFVLASSSEAYQTPSTIPTPENEMLKIPDPWNPRYSYGGSKLISEIMLANYNKNLFERALIFRPHNVYGPDMGTEHVVPQFINRAKKQAEIFPSGLLPFEIQGDGSDTRSFIYIDDFVDGLLCIINRGMHRNVYHIGTMEEKTILDIAKLVVSNLGREAQIINGPRPEGATVRRCPDISKLIELGFNPQTSLENGIKQTVDWYMAR